MEVTSLFDTESLILLSKASSYSDMLEKVIGIKIKLNGKSIGEVIKIDPTEKLSSFSILTVDLEDDYELRMIQSEYLGFSIEGYTVDKTGKRIVTDSFDEKLRELLFGEKSQNLSIKTGKTEYEELIHTLNEAEEISAQLNEIIRGYDWDLVYDGLKAKVRMMEHVMAKDYTVHVHIKDKGKEKRIENELKEVRLFKNGPILYKKDNCKGCEDADGNWCKGCEYD